MKQFFKQFFQESLPAGVRYILSWRWVKQFLYWLIISAGTIAECCFLIASLWMSVNSSVHPMILTLMSEEKSVRISYLASTIFTALPELIVAMALVTTINHCKDIRFQKDKWHTFVWPILFGLPTLVFLFISVLTVSCSVLKVNYVMPDWGIVARALSWYVFAVVYLLYEKLGEPCYADERKNLETALAQKHAEMEQAIADQKAEMARTKAHFENALQTANSNFKIAMQSRQSEFEYQINEILQQGKSRIEHLQNLLEAKDAQVQKLSERASSLEREELAFYPKVQSLWIEKAKRTVSIDEIVDVTGLSRQRIRAAITGGKIAKDNRNKDLLRVSSVVEWLKTIPVNSGPNNHSNGHAIDDENDPDPLGFPVFEVTMEG